MPNVLPKCLLVSMVIATIGAAQPLEVQNQQMTSDSFSFTLVNPRPVPVTAWIVNVTVTFSDGDTNTVTELREGYQSEQPAIAGNSKRDENESLPAKPGATVKSATASVEVTIYEDGLAIGDTNKIAKFVRDRKENVRQIQHILDRLHKAKASADPVATLVSLADVSSNDSRIKAQQQDYTNIINSLKAAKSPDVVQKALDGIIQITQARLARAQKAAEVRQGDH